MALIRFIDLLTFFSFTNRVNKVECVALVWLYQPFMLVLYYVQEVLERVPMRLGK